MRSESFFLVKTTLFVLLFIVFPSVCGNKTGNLIPKKECDKISGVEVRYNEFYELYLGHGSDSEKLQEHGIIYRSVSGAVEACCPGMELNFTLVNESVEYLVQEDLLNLYNGKNDSKLVFYFPEFTAQGKLGILHVMAAMLELRKSPGFALIMLKSESHLDISPSDVLVPSWPIFALVLSLSWAVGMLGWALELRSNPDEFPKPFVRGMFQGFWWAIVTMTTVGYGDKAPKSIVGRILCILWILAGAILLSLFTANTTSIITESRIQQNSQTMGKKIGVVNMKQFVEGQLNLGAHIIEFTHVERALEALNHETIDRLLFPHYLDLLYLLSDPNMSVPVLTDVYVAKAFEKPYQIGMVLSYGQGSFIRNEQFYTCLEIMTSRISAKYEYDYSIIDGSIINQATSTFDPDITLQYLYVILGIIGFMLITGVAFDVYNLLRNMKQDSTGNMKQDSAENTHTLSRPV